MASTFVHQEKRQHKKSTKGCSNKHVERKSIFGDIDQTKEYTVCWFCDNTTFQHDYCETSKFKLRGIIDYLQKISDINDIGKMDDQNVFLVVDFVSFDKHFAELTTFNQIHLIYVYEGHDDNKKQNIRDELFVECSKVRGPFEDIDKLFSTLSANVRTMTCQPSMVSALPPLISASKAVERSTTANYLCVTDWYMNLIRAFQEVPPARTCKEKFIEECSILYKDNSCTLKEIKEFSNTYTPEDAVRWYTRDGFLYRVLNRVLREQNQQAMQLLHFLIYDLNQQLNKELRTTEQGWMKGDNVCLYRGQLMSREELQQLRKNKGEQLFVNSFLSMTTDLAVATIFSGAGAFGPDDPMQSIIVRIEWTCSSPKQGLADIRHLSFNGDEGEILFSPTYTIDLLDCEYDAKERLWNATVGPLIQTDNPWLRINDDERLMRLELTLRHLIEEKKDSLNDDMEEMLYDDKFEFTRKFCATFIEDVPILQRELELPEFCSVTLNDDDSGRFQLKTFRSFTGDLFDHGPEIHDEMVITLYDALGSVFKTKGKLMEAYFYYQKASIYDKPQSQTSYTRQAHLAQIHKINGDYELAWNIFDELMNKTDDQDSFLYEDIVFARSSNMTDQSFLQNSRAFLQYCSTHDNDDDDHDDDETELYVDERVSYIIDAWAELGYKYFYQSHDDKQALQCYAREKELSLAASQSQSSYFHPVIGSCSERMGDVYASKNDIEKALTLYKEALDLSMKENLHINVMTLARCMCKIGRYSVNHNPNIFYDAFQHLIDGYGKLYTKDTIGKCYINLSRSLQRCERHQQALKYATQALSIFSPDPLLLEQLIDDCCQLIIELHQPISGKNNDVPTKEKLLNDRMSLNNEQIRELLQTTLDELKTEVDNK